METLLLITDDLSTRLQLKSFLEDSYIFVDAASKKEVLEILVHQKIHFVLIDYKLHEGEGIVLCKEIRQHKRFTYLPIILITEEHDGSLVERAINAGITNFLPRPHSLETTKTCLLMAKHWTLTCQNITTFSHKLKNIAEHDILTNLYNRYYLLDHGAKEVAKSHRTESPLSLIMMDIDHFKAINDTYGHLVGDELLTQFASLISNNQRSYDIIARYGGEEFVLLLPATTLKQAVGVAEKIRSIVEEHHFTTHEGQSIKITLSAGVSTIHSKDTNFESLLHESDLALYEAKNKGRNCVCH